MTSDPVQNALDAFCETWFAGERPDPEAYCQDHPECGPELRGRIESFLLAANGFADVGSDMEAEMQETEGEVEEVPKRTLGDFHILRELGRGGMGVVYEAEQISLHRRVALKVLSSHLTFSNEALMKFKREGEAGSRQRHSGIVAIYAVGKHEKEHYIAQELVEGGKTLADRLDELQKEKDLPIGYFRKAAELIAKVADALEHAHASGVIHRDIKPSNILLTHSDQPKVSDFGLAKVEGALALSRTGDFSGTPYYMSPEQATSRRIKIDHRTDIYSLGVTLYETLTLKRPFEGETSLDVLKNIISLEPSDPRKVNPRLPKDLAVICLKAMEKNPEHRYQSMKAFSEDLSRFLSGEVILAKPAGLGARFRKRIKRNPVVSASISLALVSLVVFAVVVPWIIATESQKREKQALAAKIEIEKQRNEAEAEKERAVTAEKEADRQRVIAENRFNQIIRLSDVKRLSDLEAEADRLWPAYPENIDGFKSWIKRVEDLVGRLDTHRQTLADLREMALPYQEKDALRDRESHPRWQELHELGENRKKQVAQIATLEEGSSDIERATEDSGEEKGLSKDAEALKDRLAALDKQVADLEALVSKRRTWKFNDTETQWQHDTLTGLVSGLEHLADDEGGVLKDIKDRLAFAMTIRQKSIDDHKESWDKAISSIANQEECPKYNGLVIEEMMGFVPIGRDPDSRLWEFAHLQTGGIPVRDTEGNLIRDEGMGLVFVLIPGGTFNMGAVRPSEENPIGSPNVDPEAEADENPVHEVTLKFFFLSKYEITQGQWLRFTGNNPSIYPPGAIFGGKKINHLHPVENVSWEDSVDVLFRLKLRLPSESEWEYAARAGSSTVWWTGNDKESLEGAANLADLFCKNSNKGNPSWTYEEWLDDGYVVHAPVGSYIPNAFGLHDLAGNVWEWCQDSYGRYNNTPTDGSAYEFKGAPYQVHRGGCWDKNAYYCRSAYRNWGNTSNRAHVLGFRPAANIQIKE